MQKHESRPSLITSSSASPFQRLLPMQMLQRIQRMLPLVPLSDPYQDSQGRIVQLWRLKDRFKATIISANQSLRFLSGDRVYNALLPRESGHALFLRLITSSFRKWSLVYNVNADTIHVWPRLKAAAGRGYVLKKVEPSALQQKLADIQTHLQELDIEGALKDHRGESSGTKDTGVGYQHKKEVTEACNGLRNQIWYCMNGLVDRRISSSQKDQIRHYLNQFREALSRMDRTRLHTDIRRDPRWKPPNTSDRRNNNPYPKGPGGGGKGPGGKGFKETVQQNKLTGSYNSGHPKKPIPARGGSGGSIGGVGNDVGIIKGLFDRLDDLKEDHHYFYFPTLEGEQPFSNDELRQIVEDVPFLVETRVAPVLIQAA